VVSFPPVSPPRLSFIGTKSSEKLRRVYWYTVIEGLPSSSESCCPRTSDWLTLTMEAMRPSEKSVTRRNIAEDLGLERHRYNNLAFRTVLYRFVQGLRRSERRS